MKLIIVVKGYEFSLEVGAQEPILEIKKKLENFLGVPIDSQILTVCDWELIDGMDLDDYPLISDGTKMHLLTKLHNYPHTTSITTNTTTTTKINITIKFPARKIDIEVDTLSDTVRSLKEKIHIVDGTPIRRMTLYSRGKEMEDEFRYLTEYGVQERSEVVVFMKTMTTRVVSDPPSRKIGVVVQTASSLLNAAEIPVEIIDTGRVSELSRMLVERKILPVDEYIFIHKQRIMREDCSLRWHGVQNGDYLYVFTGTVTRSG